MMAWLAYIHMFLSCVAEKFVTTLIARILANDDITWMGQRRVDQLVNAYWSNITIRWCMSNTERISMDIRRKGLQRRRRKKRYRYDKLRWMILLLARVPKGAPTMMESAKGGSSGSQGSKGAPDLILDQCQTNGSGAVCYSAVDPDDVANDNTYSSMVFDTDSHPIRIDN
jgi:hypothetical protein